MHINGPLKRHGEELIKSWLIESYNDKADSAVLNLHKIRCIPLLKELIAYNNEGNFDRVSCMILAMYQFNINTALKRNPKAKNLTKKKLQSLMLKKN